MLMDVQVQKNYDHQEQMAYEALMMRAAYHAKKLKKEDLFKRPSDDKVTEQTMEQAKKQMRRQQQWLAQFSFEKGGA